MKTVMNKLLRKHLLLVTSFKGLFSSKVCLHLAWFEIKLAGTTCCKSVAKDGICMRISVRRTIRTHEAIQYKESYRRNNVVLKL